MRVLFQKIIVERHLGERDRVTFAFSPIPKAVEDNQREWAFCFRQSTSFVIFESFDFLRLTRNSLRKSFFSLRAQKRFQPGLCPSQEGLRCLPETYTQPLRYSAETSATSAVKFEVASGSTNIYRRGR